MSDNGQNRISLGTPITCRNELQDCSNGLASLLPEFIQIREAQSVVDEQWAVIESIAIGELNPGKGETAKAVAAKVTAWVMERPELELIRAAIFDLKAQMDILERRYRNLEKRMSAAQSALKDHDAEQRGAGYQRPEVPA